MRLRLLGYDDFRKDETLEHFVRRHYHVAGSDGEVDRWRLYRVYDAFAPTLSQYKDVEWVEWDTANPSDQARPDRRDPGMTRAKQSTLLPLLEVPGVPRRDVVKRPPAERNLIYVVTWLIGLVFVSVADTGLRIGAPRLAERLISLGTPVQLLRDVTGLSTTTGGLAWPARWTLLVIGVWLYNYPNPASPYSKARLRFGLVWLAGLVVLGYASGSIWGHLPVGVTGWIWPLDGTFVLVAVWTLCIFSVYVARGDDSDGHREFVAPYRGIWFSLSLVLLGIGLATYANYQSIARRVEGLLSSRTLASQSASVATEAMGDTRIYAQRLLDSYRTLARAGTASNSQQVRDELTESIRADWVSLWQASASAAAASKSAAADVDEAIRAEGRLAAGGSGRQAGRSFLTPLIAMPVATSTQMVTLTLGTSLLATRYALTDAVSQTARIAAKVDALRPDGDPRTTAGGTAGITDVLKLRTRLATEVLTPAQTAYPRIRAAHDGLDAVGPNVVPVVVGTAALLAAFVLLPWVMLIVFLFRKRRDRAAEILGDLIRLDPSKGLLKRTLGIPDGILGPIEEAGRGAAADDPVGAGRRADAGAPPDRGKPRAGSLTMDAMQLLSLSRSVDAMPSVDAVPSPDRGATVQRGDDVADVKDLTTVINRLATRTFNSAEYVLCLGLLSVLVSVGWYFVLYPQTSVGLALVIVRGANVLSYTDMIWQNLTPVTAGFLGAYFFVIYQLVNRYLAADLYPAAFLQATERFAIVFILSLMLWVVVLAGDVVGDAFDSLAPTTADLAYLAALGLAFIAGIWPREGLRQVIGRIQALGRASLALDEHTTPLTQLEGLTIWDESRLREEKVSDVQSLATTAVGDLVVNTHYPATQIVDWIDQALLYVHAGQDGELYPAFRWVGIRTATDLLDAIGYRLVPRRGEDKEDLRLDEPAPRGVGALCQAIQSAAAAHKDLPIASGQGAEDAAKKLKATVQVAEAEDLDLQVKVIVDAILPDQNVDYILNWYAWLGKTT